MVDEKKAFTGAEREARRREKAAADGFKSCSVGLVRVEHIEAFKAAAALSRLNKLQLDNGQLFAIKTVERVVEKRIGVPKNVPVIDLSPLVPLVTSRWPLAIAAVVGFVIGAGFVFSIR
jgi:hypothetical protein